MAGRGRFLSASRRPIFFADKVGGDGGLAPDSFGDVVVDVDFDGPAFALFLKSEAASIEATTPFGEMRVRSMDGSRVQKHVATLIAFEGERALNDRSQPLELGEGRHRLTLRVSGYHVRPDTPWRIYAVRPDCTVTEGPTIR